MENYNNLTESLIFSSEKTKNHDITTGIVFRIFSNLFAHEKGRNLMSKLNEEVYRRIPEKTLSLVFSQQIHTALCIRLNLSFLHATCTASRIYNNLAEL